jgi:hypothetical protein
MFYAYKPSSRINLEYWQAMVVAWRRYGIISRKKYLSVSNVLFHIKYLEKT